MKIKCDRASNKNREPGTRWYLVRRGEGIVELRVSGGSAWVASWGMGTGRW
jgi:hypothetical protein